MIAALATVATTVLIWGMARFVLSTIEQDGSKIIAALRGRSIERETELRRARPVSFHYRPRPVEPGRPERDARMTIGVEWRAAA